MSTSLLSYIAFNSVFIISSVFLLLTIILILLIYPITRLWLSLSLSVVIFRRSAL
jgi:hypothetical protein